MSEFDPIIHEKKLAKEAREKALANQAAKFEAEKAFLVNDAVEAKQAAKRKNYEARFGLFGKYILDAGSGGGFYAVPDILDEYENCLGLDIKQAWLMKRLLKYLPNVKPSMGRIAKEAGIDRSKVSRIKTQLIQKGFVRDTGGRGGDVRGANELDLSNFFAAVFLCALCDPNSNLVKGQAADKIRAEFTKFYKDAENAEYYEKQIDLAGIELPLSIEQAKRFADAKGFELNWLAIEQMQNGDAMAKFEEAKEDKMRVLEVKDAINEGKGGEFNIIWNFGRAYDWLKWLSSLPLSTNEIERMTKIYTEQDAQPTAKGYMQWMTDILNRADLKQAIVEREVYNLTEVEA